MCVMCQLAHPDGKLHVLMRDEHCRAGPGVKFPRRAAYEQQGPGNIGFCHKHILGQRKPPLIQQDGRANAVLHRYQFPRLAARFRDVRKPIPAVDEPAVVPRCRSSLIDEYSEVGGSRPAALSNQWGVRLGISVPTCKRACNVAPPRFDSPSTLEHRGQTGPLRHFPRLRDSRAAAGLTTPKQ